MSIFSPASLPGSEEDGGEGGGEKGIVVQENKGFFQRLKEVFWKEEEEGEKRQRQEGT